MCRPAQLYRLHITPRDIDIILMVHRYDGLVSKIIKRRFWANLAVHTTFYDRLSRLVSAGFLRTVRLPSHSGLGSGPTLLTIGPAAHPILVERLGLTINDLRRLRHSFVPMFVAHELAVRDLRFQLELACEGSPLVTLDEWVNESELKRSPIKVRVADPRRVNRTISVELVSDGLFTLSVDGRKSKRYYLEVDRDTESGFVLRKRIRGYLAHVGSSASPVLFVVPSPSRQRRIAQWISEEAQALSMNPRIFAIAQSSQLTEQTILHPPVWQVVGEDSLTSLVPQTAAANARGQPTATAIAPSAFEQLLVGKGAV